MKGMKRVAKGIGKVVLVLLAGVLMPVLIWVAFGAALNQKLREQKLHRAPVLTIGDILKRSGLIIREGAARK